MALSTSSLAALAGLTDLRTIDPAIGMITIDNGVAPPLQLTAKLDGAPVVASWSSGATFLGAVDDNGLVSVSGNYGGTIDVEAEHDAAR